MLGELDLGGVLIQADARLLNCRRRHGRKITWTLPAKQAPEHISEAWRGDSWIVGVEAARTREGKAFYATHAIITSLCSTLEALLQLVRDRWTIECWHLIRDTQLHEDAHRYRGNGAGAMAMRKPRPNPY